MTLTGKRIVIVEWFDALCENGWQGAGTKFKAMHCRTIGFLEQEDADVVAIAGTIAEDGGTNQIMTIPKGMIISMEDVPHG